VRICAAEPQQWNGKDANSKHASKSTPYNFWIITTGHKLRTAEKMLHSTTTTR